MNGPVFGEQTKVLDPAFLYTVPRYALGPRLSPKASFFGLGFRLQESQARQMLAVRSFLPREVNKKRGILVKKLNTNNFATFFFHRCMQIYYKIKRKPFKK
jgi:hypothetical protein